MKYSVEIENGIAKETLIFNGKEYVRTTEKTYYGSSAIDIDFSEQMKNDGLDSDVLDQIYDTLDGFLVGDLLDIAESEKAEQARKEVNMERKKNQPQVPCEWMRQKDNYVAGCINIRTIYNKHMVWCPYCGKIIHVMNTENTTDPWGQKK